MLFRLRHLNTGRLVCAAEVEYEGQMITTLSLSDHLELKRDENLQGDFGKNLTYEYSFNQEQKDEIQENTLFRLLSTNAEEHTDIKDHDCIKI
jgi:hypothetical protein